MTLVRIDVKEQYPRDVVPFGLLEGSEVLEARV